MAPSYAVWGALFGWLVMPRIGKARKIRAMLPVLAYFFAVVVVSAIIFYFDFHRQTKLFIVGMAVQMTIFIAAAWLRRLMAKTGSDKPGAGG